MPFTDPMFSGRSLWTMAHGILLSGGALMGLAAALFHMHAVRPTVTEDTTDGRSFAALTVATAVLLWLAVLVGTYVIFPQYRATPPAGLTDLAAYPRALILADPANAWLHRFGMEIKEHVPWIAAMLVTAVAFVSVRYRAEVLRAGPLRGMAMSLLAASFALVSVVGLLGVLINKIAPLE